MQLVWSSRTPFGHFGARLLRERADPALFEATLTAITKTNIKDPGSRTKVLLVDDHDLIRKAKARVRT